MSLTLLAGMLAPLYLKLVLDPKGSHKSMKEIGKSEGLTFSLALFYFILAGLILSSTGFNFAFELESLLAWLGLLVFVKGIFILIPNLLERTMKRFDEKSYPVLGFVGLIFMLLLVYVDLKVLA